MEAKGLCEISMEEFDKMQAGEELRLYLKSDMDEIVVRIAKDELRKISPLALPISQIKGPRKMSTSTRKLMSMAQRKRWAKIKRSKRK